MKQPLGIVALLYAGGLLIGNIFQPPLVWLFAVSLAIAAAALLLNYFRSFLIWPLIVLTGWTNLVWHTAVVSPMDLRVLLRDKPALATVRGTLVATPTERVYVNDEQESFRTMARLKVTAIQRGTNWEPALGQVAIISPGELAEDFFAGREVEVYGVLGPPPGPLAEGLFDFRNYLRRQEIYFQLKTKSAADWKIVGDRKVSPPLNDRFTKWAKGALAIGMRQGATGIITQGSNDPVVVGQSDGSQVTNGPQGIRPRPTSARQTAAPYLGGRGKRMGRAERDLASGSHEDESLGLERALTLGDKTFLTEDVSEPFVQASTYHIFAVDGLRMAIVFGIFFEFFRALRMPRIVCGLVLIPLIWFYVALTGWPASAIRASVMLTIVILGWTLRRPGDVLNSLFAAAVIILVWQPQQLFQAGFQLSFFVVLCILLVMPVFDGWIQRWLRPDPLLPEELRPRWRRRLDAPLRWGLGLFFSSLAAWLGSIPLAAYYFHIITPVSTVANVVAVPLCVLVLASNLISLVLAAWFPFGAGVFNHIGWFLMECIRVSSHWFANWPEAYAYVPMPSLFTMAVYYAVLLAVLTGWLFESKRRAWKIGGLVLLAAVWCGNWLHERSATQITVLPLSGGSAVYCENPGAKNDVLIDCGNSGPVEFVIKPYLRAQGVNALPGLALTVGAAQQVGGFEKLDGLMPIKKVVTSAVKFRSSAYRDIVQDLEKSPGRLQLVDCGDSFANWTALYPPGTSHFTQADSDALVLRGEFHGTRVLLLSDLAREGQRELFERNTDLRADIVVAGLPEQGEPLSNALLKAIQPQLIVVADSDFPVTRRASRALQARLGRSGVPVIYTRSAGAVKITIRKGGCEASSAERVTLWKAEAGMKNEE